MALQNIKLVNAFASASIFNIIACAGSNDQWYKTQGLTAATQIILAGGNAQVSAQCSASAPWDAIVVWNANAQVGDLPDSYVVVDPSTGAIMDSKTSTLFSYVTSNVGGTFTVTVQPYLLGLPLSTISKKYWMWILALLLLLLLVGGGIAAVVMLARRRSK